ncbi:DUF4360 domain-containing protein [Actinosynnema sp. CS-041913]|uniref:DUF4360 domain-containing protein n=1 Tax=Actinosynnema sp. CS-041913 TaxID=3239917 RepID=UPI003D929718
MLSMATATLLALSAVVPAPGAADSDHPGPPISVSVVATIGSGCRNVFVMVGEDNESFTTAFGRFIAEVGGATGPTLARESCRLHLQIVLPKGYTYGVARATYNGYVHVEPGATATHKADFHFQGQVGTAKVESRFAGPLTDEWQAEYASDPREIAYLPCGESRNLITNAELRADLGTSDPARWSMISADYVDAPAHAEYRLAIKTC